MSGGRKRVFSKRGFLPCRSLAPSKNRGILTKLATMANVHAVHRKKGFAPQAPKTTRMTKMTRMASVINAGTLVPKTLFVHAREFTFFLHELVLRWGVSSLEVDPSRKGNLDAL